ncbi:VOC family protein [Halobacillus yeomjeoni]|uniref:VOC family protein n=1 Tax=Halobacillus yeomjeoni TaxID=311194 RepID=UPI001CD7B278|nr:VOC family protein [Halobacillus yeomjeoni]MCA0983206.1 VOC family protein [Halobacillus yeomjeoni]
MHIDRVHLYTNRMDELKDFYIRKLEFELVSENDHSFEMKIGSSRMVFHSTLKNRQPFYHFAFNLPSNKFEDAKQWAKAKVSLSKEEGEDDVYFDFLKSKAFYFTDPGGNIVELIARQSLSPVDKKEGFHPTRLLNISEMSLTTDDVLTVGRHLQGMGLPVREGEPLEMDTLNFLGETKSGAFLLLGPQGRRWIFSEQHAETHPLKIKVNGGNFIELNEEGEASITHSF